MKILYYFQELPSPMYQWQRTHLIDELQRHGHLIETINPLLFESPEKANEELIGKIKTKRYDLFFTNVCYKKMLYIESLECLRAKGIPSLCLRCDNLVVPFNDKELAPYFDLVWLTSKETQHLYDKWEVSTFFLPYAANPYTFVPSNEIEIRRVCFIGTPYGSRSLMINTLTSSNIKVDLYYGGNPLISNQTFNPRSNILTPSKYKIFLNRLRFPEGRKLLVGSIINKLKGQTKVEENNNLCNLPAVNPDDISKYYSKYDLCLASTSTNHTDVLKNPLKIINLRNFEIPMSGGIEICKYNPELAEYFEQDKEIIFYRSNEELIEKSKYYTQKASSEEILRIKRNARKRAEADHTWMKRFEQIFAHMGI